MHNICNNFFLRKCETGGELGQLVVEKVDGQSNMRIQRQFNNDLSMRIGVESVLNRLFESHLNPHV